MSRTAGIKSVRIGHIVSTKLVSEIHAIPYTKNVMTLRMKKRLTTHSFNKCLIRSNLYICSGPTQPTYVRYYHDWKTPDFTENRRDSTKLSTSKYSDTIDQRKLFTQMIHLMQGIAFMYGAKAHTIHYVSVMAASADVLALAKIEVNLDDIPEGKNATIKWRGKPLFVKHRSEEQIKIERSVDISTLRDPQTDEERVQDPKWLVCLGICTHLGCVPISGAGDFPGGYYCPCHGSHFDGSGRARKGPAPTNLEIPPYKIEGNILTVG